jgi:hypothetical protein
VIGALRPVVALLATWRGRLIAAVLATQLLLPLRYYLLARDPHDERFAWRMFSPTRMERCKLQLVESGKPVALGREFHETWVELAQRGRFAVAEAMAAELCARRSNATVTVELACTRLDDHVTTYVSGDDGRMHERDDDHRAAADVCGAP